jgi:hypothetical protein
VREPERREERVYTAAPADRTYNREVKPQTTSSKDCCSTGCIVGLCLLCCLITIIALLFGLGVWGGPIPSGNTTTASGTTVAAAGATGTAGAAGPVAAGILDSTQEPQPQLLLPLALLP